MKGKRIKSIVIGSVVQLKSGGPKMTSRGRKPRTSGRGKADFQSGVACWSM
jgi:uncharacterized protein YodC (DUF2158 family)